RILFDRMDGKGPAEPIDLEPGNEVRRAFYETHLGRSQSEIKAHWSKAVFTGRGRPRPDVDDVEAMKERLADDPQAIGYLDHRQVDGSVRVVPVVGAE
ncbi:MAG: phosphate ABC transporter substrate-binding protein, partial [Gemmatimonadota bacterium]